MKNQLLLTVIFCILAFSSFGNMTEVEEESWIKLDWLIRGTVPFQNDRRAEIELSLWWDDILVAIGGQYNTQDSLELDKIIKEFNTAIPNRNIRWCIDKEPTLVVFFTELNKPEIRQNKFILNYDVYSTHYINGPSILLNHKFNIRKAIKATLFLQNVKNQSNRNQLLWQGFGKMMVGNEIRGGFKIGKLSVLGGELCRLTAFDKFFFKTIYSTEFRQQYASFLKSEYNLWEQFTFLTNDETKTTMVFLIQTLLIALFVFTLYFFIWQKKLKQRVKSNFWKFAITGLIVIVPLSIVTVITFPFFTTPLMPVNSPSNFKFLISVILALSNLIFGFFLIAVLFFIEHIVFGAVNKYSNRQLIRVASVFTCMFLWVLFSSSIKNYYSLTTLNIIQSSTAFLIFTTARFVYFHDQHQKEIISHQQLIKISKLEQLQTQFQLEAVQARTNPHFLYNSLNTIASLAKQDADKTEDFALKLSKLLRLRLSENQAVEISLNEEIETTKLYLEIEKERFYDRLNYTINFPEESGKTQIPSNILFCLAENAVKHGINSGGNKISIDIEENRQTITLSVSDNGNNFPENPVFGTGLKSLMEKLEILFPNNHELAIKNKPEKKIMVTLAKNGIE